MWKILSTPVKTRLYKDWLFVFGSFALAVFGKDGISRNIDSKD